MEGIVCRIAWFWIHKIVARNLALETQRPQWKVEKIAFWTIPSSLMTAIVTMRPVLKVEEITFWTIPIS